MDTSIYNVKDYGAKGDGETKDTHALQKAVDACAEAGGGTVILPAGRYLSGTIYLKSHVNLHLTSGATVLGSPDAEDYNREDVFPENYASSRDRASGAHLIIAYLAENVSITGTGKIDGNSAAFFDPLPESITATYRYKNGDHPFTWRTGAMIYFCRCKRVAVRESMLLNSPYWTLLLLGCDDVQIHGLTIESPPATRNGDGIDIDCCRRVNVSDCIIRTGDDCITLRGNKRPLGPNAQPCEDITVTGCVLSTPCNAIRVGVGLGEIRRASFSNIIVSDSRTAINIVSSYSEDSHGASIEQIQFSDFIIDAINPIVVHVGPGAADPGGIRDIQFYRFRVTASAGSQWVGKATLPLKDIVLSDIEWHVRGGTDNEAFVEQLPAVLSHHGYLGVKGQPALPAALYGAHMQNAVFNNVRIYWEHPSSVWRDGILVDHADGVDFRNLVLRQPQVGFGSAVHLRKSDKINIQGCHAPLGTHIFMHVEDALPNAKISSAGNNLHDAKQPFLSNAQVDVVP